MNTSDATQTARPQWEHDQPPRWLRYSRLAQALQLPRDWLLFYLLVILDHQTARLGSRRRPPEKRGFVAPHRALVLGSGLSPRTVHRGLAELAQTKLLKRYAPGRGRDKRGGRWSEFEVDRDTIKALYFYVAPHLTREEGGLSGGTIGTWPGDGLLIYGVPKHGELVFSLERMSAAASLAHEQSGIDLSEIRRICGIPEDSNRSP